MTLAETVPTCLLWYSIDISPLPWSSPFTLYIRHSRVFLTFTNWQKVFFFFVQCPKNHYLFEFTERAFSISMHKVYSSLTNRKAQNKRNRHGCFNSSAKKDLPSHRVDKRCFSVFLIHNLWGPNRNTIEVFNPFVF